MADHSDAVTFRKLDINDEQNRELSFFDVLSDISASHSCRDVPINRPDFVTDLVFPELVEIHPVTPEHAMVLAGESGLDDPAGTDFQASDFLQDFRGRTHRKN